MRRAYIYEEERGREVHAASIYADGTLALIVHHFGLSAASGWLELSPGVPSGHVFALPSLHEDHEDRVILDRQCIDSGRKGKPVG